MNLHHLLHQRKALLAQARLANLAYAYQRLGVFADRIAGAGLRGEVCLHEADADLDVPWAGLTALEGNQSVIEEHFTDEDILELADLLDYATDGEGPTLTFRLEELGSRFRPPLRRQLERAGVTLEPSDRPLEESSHGHSG